MQSSPIRPARRLARVAPARPGQLRVWSWCSAAFPLLLQAAAVGLAPSRTQALRLMRGSMQPRTPLQPLMAASTTASQHARESHRSACRSIWITKRASSSAVSSPEHPAASSARACSSSTASRTPRAPARNSLSASADTSISASTTAPTRRVGSGAGRPRDRRPSCYSASRWRLARSRWRASCEASRRTTVPSTWSSGSGSGPRESSRRPGRWFVRSAP